MKRNKDITVFSKNKRRPTLRRSWILPLGFLLIILLGASLLTLPMASQRERLGFFEAVFTATSATCVTGLIVVDTGTWFTGFGQAVLLGLIQVGGLGFMTFTSYLFSAAKRRVSLRDRLILSDSLGQVQRRDGLQLAVSAIKLTFGAEAVGAVLLSFRFIPQFGWEKGVWYSIFHSVSAYCNAGFDVLGGGQSLTQYVGDPVVMFPIMALIVLGGLGFVVVDDIAHYKKGKGLLMQTKLVLIVTMILLGAGAILFLAFEYRNEETLSRLSQGEKWMAALFQSVTCRTAGFNSIDQAGMTDASKLLSSALMVVGAAPAGTAGGIKITTLAVLLLEVRALILNQRKAVVCGRSLSFDMVRKALCLLTGGIGLLFIGSTAISLAHPEAAMIDIIYECASALGTAGLSAGLTGMAGRFSLAILCVFMYVGRVGFLSILFMLSKEEPPALLNWPEENIMIG